MTDGQPRIPIWIYFAITNAVFVVGVVIVLVVAWPRPDAEDEGETSVDPELVQVGDLSSQAAAETEHTSRASAVATASDDAGLSAAEIVAAVKPGVVVLTTYDSTGKRIGFASGFVVRQDGLIATNFHALNRASSADVRFSDDEVVAVRGVRKWNPFTDLAILDSGELPGSAVTLPLDDTESRTDAEELLCIGHPHGLRFTTSHGILSGAYAESDMPRQYRTHLNADFDHTWLQHSATIAGGSSGGPLLNMRGEVIGINSLVFGETSFAIDGRHLREMLAELGTTTQSLVELTGPGEKLDELTQEFEDSANAFNMKLSSIQDEKDRVLYSAANFPATEYAEKMYRFAQEHLDSPAAFEAIGVLCVIASQQSAPDACNSALNAAAEYLAAHHADDPRIVDLVWSIQQSRLSGARSIFEKVAQNSTNRNVKGVSYYCAATSYQVSGSDEDLSAAMKLLERVVRDYPDVVYQCRHPSHPEHRVGDDSRASLHRMKRRVVGN